MSIKIAVTGKSGSGKTTVTKNLYNIIKKYFPEKSILLFDNDLSEELGNSFGLNIRNTIYGIRSGKHEYRTGIPQQMTKQEYIEWAIEDIIISIEENTDIIASWFVGAKDCRCPITEQLNSALKKLINRYDFVIFDCEYDLKYLNQLLDTEIDLSLIIANPTIESITLAKRIEEYSAKYAVGGQLGVIINKVGNEELPNIFETAKELDIEILGSIPTDNNLTKGSSDKYSKIVEETLANIYTRLNLPQENNR